MYAIRPNIAGGVGVAARRYNYSTQPQERMLPLRRKEETKYRNQCFGSAMERILLFTSVRIRIQEVKPTRIIVTKSWILIWKIIIYYVIKYVVKAFLKDWNSGLTCLFWFVSFGIPNTDSDPDPGEPNHANPDPRHWLQNTQLSISGSVLVWEIIESTFCTRHTSKYLKI